MAQQNRIDSEVWSGTKLPEKPTQKRLPELES